MAAETTSGPPGTSGGGTKVPETHWIPQESLPGVASPPKRGAEVPRSQGICCRPKWDGSPEQTETLTQRPDERRQPPMTREHENRSVKPSATSRPHKKHGCQSRPPSWWQRKRLVVHQKPRKRQEQANAKECITKLQRPRSSQQPWRRAPPSQAALAPRAACPGRALSWASAR